MKKFMQQTWVQWTLLVTLAVTLVICGTLAYKQYASGSVPKASELAGIIPPEASQRINGQVPAAPPQAQQPQQPQAPQQAPTTQPKQPVQRVMMLESGHTYMIP